jgi:HSP20 family protein
MPGRTVHAKLELASCFRQYPLTESLDLGKAAADFTDGVLTLRIPTTEEALHKFVIMSP